MCIRDRPGPGGRAVDRGVRPVVGGAARLLADAGRATAAAGLQVRRRTAVAGVDQHDNRRDYELTGEEAHAKARRREGRKEERVLTQRRKER